MYYFIFDYDTEQYIKDVTAYSENYNFQIDINGLYRRQKRHDETDRLLFQKDDFETFLRDVLRVHKLARSENDFSPFFLFSLRMGDLGFAVEANSFSYPESLLFLIPPTVPVSEASDGR